MHKELKSRKPIVEPSLSGHCFMMTLFQQLAMDIRDDRIFSGVRSDTLIHLKGSLIRHLSEGGGG